MCRAGGSDLDRLDRDYTEVIARVSIARAAALVFFSMTGASWTQELSLEERGQALVARMCGQCHAINLSGASSHPAAPPFRRLGDQIDLDAFSERLREGLFTGHSDMPQIRMSREDARAVSAYLRAVQGR
jgi:mono/diheme cytochrome c family protein